MDSLNLCGGWADNRGSMDRPLRVVRALAAALTVSAALAGSAVAAPAQSSQLPVPLPPVGKLIPQLFEGQPASTPAPDDEKRAAFYESCAAQNAKPVTQAQDPRGVDPASPNPLAGLKWFVDTQEHAWTQWISYRRRGMANEANLMWKIAREPRFRWFGKWTRPNQKAKLRRFLNRVQCSQPGTVPQMIVMRHQGKACNKRYAAGGRREDARQRHWYDNFVQAVGNARVVIGFEPDSLGTIDCLKKSRRKARLRTLRYGVDRLSTLPNATIYLEAGASDWESARRTAKQLRIIGIHKVRGFMLNVTHYDWTHKNIAHGLKISRKVGGKPFVISTAFNGRGPLHYRKPGRGKVTNVWCHPPNRGSGPRPTTQTGHPKVDGYLWIGRPGYSGGSCNGGPLPVGSWWAKRALMFARNSVE